MIVAGLAAATTAALLLPVLSDLLSLLSRSKRDAPPAEPGSLPRLTFLVPAFNEELLITQCIASLRHMDYPADRFTVVVIADNCTDSTADIARASGTLCLERHDESRRGKPHAIAWALSRIPDSDAVVIVDADAVVDRGFALGIAAHAPLSGKAVQTRNGVSNEGESAITRMAAVLASAKFEFAFRLKRRAGLNVPLGAGSCIGTAILARHGWQAFTIGEDWEMYALLTSQGIPIELAPTARLYAQEAKSLRQVSTQRRRWTAGRLTVLAMYWRRIMLSRAIGPRQKLDAIAELLAPGPAVHLGVVIILAQLLPLVVSVPGWLAALAWLSLARPAVYAMAAISASTDRRAAIGAFLHLPIYLVVRLLVEAAALCQLRANRWVRTARHVPAR